jgi:hypothetical protein
VNCGGDYILTVKANQPTLHKQLKALPWKQIPVCDRSTEHGRATKRALNALVARALVDREPTALGT